VARREERERERKERTESVLTLTFGEYPCSYKKGVQVPAGGSALVLTVRISSGVEKEIQEGVSK
jgi:hypothetical protein